MKLKRNAFVFFIALLPCLSVAPCLAEQTWGHVRGRFVWDGKVPKPASLEVTKGVGIKDDSLLVNPGNRGIANVAVYLIAVNRGESIPIHPSYSDEAHKEVNVFIRGGQFIPHAAAIRTSQTLVLKNDDNVGHNPTVSTNRNVAYNLPLRPGDRSSVTFSHAEKAPSITSGSVHPWLRGCLLVSDHPYATFSHASGEFEIRDLPTGQWMLQVWHERAGFITSATLDSQSMTWERGRVAVHVQPGTYDMGDVRVGSEQFRTP